MNNPVTFDYASAQRAFHQNAQDRRSALRDFERAGKERAEAEKDYRRQLAVTFARLRADGKGTTEAELLSKGEIAVLEKSLARDMADVAFKTAAHRIEQLEGERAGIRSLATWSQRVEPLGEQAA